MWWPNKQTLFTLTLLIWSIHSFPFRQSPFQNFSTGLQRKLIKFGEVLVSRYYKLNEIYVERKIVITSYFPDFALQKTSSAVTVMGSTAKSLFLCMWCSWIKYCASLFKAEEKLTLAMVRRFLLSLKYIYKSHSKKGDKYKILRSYTNKFDVYKNGE